MVESVAVTPAATPTVPCQQRLSTPRPKRQYPPSLNNVIENKVIVDMDNTEMNKQNF